MSAISTILARLRAAIWAIDVRDDIANAIEQCYDDVHNPTLNTEAIQAAVQAKIDAGKMAALTIGDHTITAAKLAQGVIDNTLATSGAAADAKKTGDEIAAVKADLGVFKETGGADKYISNVKVYGSPASIGISNIRNNYGSANAKQTGFAIFPATTDTEWTSAIKNVTDASVSGHFKETLGDGRTYEFDYDLSGLASGTRDTVRDSAHIINRARFYDIPSEEKESELTPEIKSALLACFRALPFANGDDELYDNLYNALYADEPIITEPVYEIPHGTDISTWSIDTGQHAYTLNENFTFVAKVTSNTAELSTNVMFLIDSLSTDTPLVGMRIQANISNGNLTFLFGFNGADSGGGIGGTGSGVYTANQTHTVTFILVNNSKIMTAKMYVDGSLNYQNTATLTDKATTYPETYYVGKNRGGSRPWHGVVDVFRIYNKALTTSEIERILSV